MISIISLKIKENRLIHFYNTYSKLPSSFFERALPESFDEPRVIAFNFELAKELGINIKNLQELELAKIFSGQKLLEGSEPIALAYAAHQFGYFVPQLGDGRAILLGEVKGFDIQLKGAGRTKFSRNGDGRSALGPVLREYILSEAMFNLGVPTTRALAAVETGELVYREYEEPGGIFTRVAPGHIRVGTFQYFAAQKDYKSISILLDYAIERNFPELLDINDQSQKALAFIRSVINVQSDLIAKWMSLGFIHGVMNTDNFSIAGFTLDYGPCAFMDEYKANKVFSSVDRNKRYAYNNQVEIGQWNIMRLCECLLPLVGDDQESVLKTINELLDEEFLTFNEKKWIEFGKKFGLDKVDSTDIKMMESYLSYLEENELDFTNSFRSLEKLYHGDLGNLNSSEELVTFLNWWRKRVPALGDLKGVNPWLIPRNHLVEAAIRSSYLGDHSKFERLNLALKHPYLYNDKYSDLAQAPTVSERVSKTFCGT